jgi:hypothetical protein
VLRIDGTVVISLAYNIYFSLHRAQFELPEEARKITTSKTIFQRDIAKKENTTFK